MKLDPGNSIDFDIMVALRGPDKYDDNLKTVTVSVLRYFVGVRENNTRGATVYTPEYARQHWRRPAAISAEERYRSHFLHHMRTAFSALVAHPDLGEADRDRVNEHVAWLCKEEIL